MASLNSFTYQTPLTNFCSIDILKSLVENPLQLPTAMLKFAKINTDHSPEYEFMIRYLQEIYHPSEDSIKISKNKQNDINPMRTKDRLQPTVGIREPLKKTDLGWENERNIHLQRTMEKNLPINANRMMHRPYPEINPVADFTQLAKQMPILTPGFGFNPTFLPMNNKMVHAKRRLDLNNVQQDLLKKKVRTNPEIQDLSSKNVIEIDDEVDIIPPVKTRKKDRRIIQQKPITRTGLKNIKSKKIPIIIDSPEIPSKTGFIEEEKEGDRETTTNATNRTNMDEIIDNDKGASNGFSKDEGLDFGDLNIDDLGIKILEEVFLCIKCQKQIPQKDTEKGFKEICQACSKTKTTRASSSKRNQISKQEQEIINAKNESENKEKYNILAPIFQNREYYEESAKHNILDQNQIQKLIQIGKGHQITIAPMNLYEVAQKKKMRKLWTPERLEFSVYEKFRNDVNGKNSVYLIDEEITEILVRHKYNIEQALAWSMKSNPEFQYYVKRSANRRRMMTRGIGGRNYSSIYE